MAESPTKYKGDWEKASDVSPGTGGDEKPIHIDPHIRRKVDLHLLPLIATLYLCSFLDRGNIGNARVAGMETDLGLTGVKYQLAAAVFFIPYSLMEIPCNIMLKFVRPSIWIPGIMVAWGFVMVMMSFVKSFQGLVVARVFLGLTEAGLAPGVAFLVTNWYCRGDQARPISLYFSSATIAGAFGGLFAYLLEKLNGHAGLHGWQWIFLIEGLGTIFFAAIAFWKLPDYPLTAKFLTEDEKAQLVEVLKDDNLDELSHFERKFVWQIVKDYKSWIQTLIYLGTVMPIYSFALFLPTIITALGYKANIAQLMTIPPYAIGCVCTIVIGALSDHHKMRGLFVMGGTLFGIIGYAMLYASSPTNYPGIGYAGSIIAACGIFPTIPIMLAWGSGNAGNSFNRAVMIGLMSGVGNLGGICSSFIYRTKDTPRYHLGHGIAIGFLCMTFMLSAFATYLYHGLNKQKRARCIAEAIMPNRKTEFASLGTNSPLFYYVL